MFLLKLCCVFVWFCLLNQLCTRVGCKCWFCFLFQCECLKDVPFGGELVHFLQHHDFAHDAEDTRAILGRIKARDYLLMEEALQLVLPKVTKLNFEHFWEQLVNRPLRMDYMHLYIISRVFGLDIAVIHRKGVWTTLLDREWTECAIKLVRYSAHEFGMVRERVECEEFERGKRARERQRRGKGLVVKSKCSVPEKTETVTLLLNDMLRKQLEKEERAKNSALLKQVLGAVFEGERERERVRVEGGNALQMLADVCGQAEVLNVNVQPVVEVEQLEMGDPIGVQQQLRKKGAKMEVFAEIPVKKQRKGKTVKPVVKPCVVDLESCSDKEVQYCCTFDGCSKIFSLKQNLVRHMKVHSDAKFCCSDCGRKFFDVYSLRSHELVHMDERGFKCKKCGAAFTMRKNLVRHQKIHSKQKYPCSQCEMVFEHPDYLKQHSRYHDRKFIVRPCGFSYIWASQLLQHKKSCRECRMLLREPSPDY